MPALAIAQPALAARPPAPSETPPALDAHGFQTLGAITRVEQEEAAVVLHCGEARLRLAFLDDRTVRVRLAPPGSEFGHTFSYAVDPATAGTWPGPSALVVDETADAVLIRTPGLSVRALRAACRLAFFDAGGALLVEDEAGAAWGHEHDARTPASWRLRPGERVLGLGDKPEALDRRGGRFEMWNTDAFRYERGSDPLYKSIPFLVGLHESVAYGLFLDTPHRTHFDVGSEHGDRLRAEAQAGGLDYYVFAADTALGVVEAYARLTGRTPMLPKWALGYHQSRYSYGTEAEVREVAAELRARKIPCDVVHLDIHYMDGFRVFTWDADAFPDPAALLGDLAADGFRTVAIVDPGVKADDEGYAVHQDGTAFDAFLRYPDGNLFEGEVWPGRCHFPDFTRPDVRAWWGGLHAPMLDAGVDGIWNDMNEPAVFTVPGSEVHAGTIPSEVRHDFDGRGADHAEAHNVYGMQMARATHEGLRRLRPDARPFVLTRAAHAGSQRFGTAWTGDNSATWDHLKLAVQQGLGLNASGFPFVGADVGGFSGAPVGELMTRWMQLGALMPLFRNHSAIDTPRREPWLFGEETEQWIREAIELRYMLLPYFYTAVRETCEAGTPFLRALALVHPEDETIRRTSPLGFYVGETLLAHPVVEPGQTSREVYLPAAPGGWYCLHTGDRFASRSTIWTETPMHRIPLYARAGSVVPMGPIVQHTGERVERLTLRVFPTPGAFTSHLYDDAGDGWAFLEGEHFDATFTGRWERGRLSLRTDVAGTFRPAWAAWDVEVFGLDRAPSAVRVGKRAVPFRFEDGVLRFEMPVGAPFDVDG